MILHQFDKEIILVTNFNLWCIPFAGLAEIKLLPGYFLQ